MQKLLLHICCGVCAGVVVQRLRQEGFDVRGFFYNPNIYPREEYLRRQETARKVAGILDFEIICAPYEKDLWLAKTKGLEGELEGGRRCLLCFKMRLEAAQKKARLLGISKFATTLTISRHKNSAAINKTGRAISREEFLARDFKAQDGFKLAMEFARSYNLYRQTYCGCIYSSQGPSLSRDVSYANGSAPLAIGTERSRSANRRTVPGSIGEAFP